MIKSVSDEPIYTLLSPENNVIYRIPPYQREYSWSKQQWDELFDDLLDADADSGHFLGTIICVNQTQNSTQETVLELIDGQQRMTTLSLLLAAIYGALQANSDELDDEDRTDLNNLRRQLVLKRPTRERIRPQKQNSNHDDYLNVLKETGIEIEAPKVRNFGNRRIRRSYGHFKNRISAHAEQTGKGIVDVALDVLGRVKRATLVKLEVANHADAFVLFESLNNRGLPLTPIDLIKNNLLAASDRHPELGAGRTFDRWNELLADLGDDYAIQERFFRHHYNAFKATLPAVSNAPVATRSKLIRIYEALIAADLPGFLDGISGAGAVYKRIVGNLDDEDEVTDLDRALAALTRAQGAPSHILLLFLLRNRDQLDLTDARLAAITRLLSSFFVRRNLTGTPQTYALPALFMDIIGKISGLRGDQIESMVREQLRRVSASEDQFRDRLHGPIYEENVEVARFILVALAEQGMTKETRTDLWEYERTHFKWTIEHILPQGENLPAGWVEMLGGDASHAAEVQQRCVHTLGNLTLTGYNSNLGNKSFQEKMERKDANGNFIGFRNALRLNEDVAAADRWTETEIANRTDRLAAAAMQLFPI
ncbi:DUF262 domain-containing protein [Mycolicibacter heraklionensis]|uniref:DUF262 domain-containing protein n=1 Tax=Mycolicibacter heraklionensis TaxID=512402 RepID=UPI0007EAF3A8|nr:DUF262 domain-containing protein [Mycolicibacter heraklionensis]OBG34919.1 hypothetical protein A5671_03705 [Mycolicibacter heraklionensis]